LVEAGLSGFLGSGLGSFQIFSPGSYHLSANSLSRNSSSFSSIFFLNALLSACGSSFGFSAGFSCFFDLSAFGCSPGADDHHVPKKPILFSLI